MLIWRALCGGSRLDRDSFRRDPRGPSHFSATLEDLNGGRLASDVDDGKPRCHLSRHGEQALRAREFLAKRRGRLAGIATHANLRLDLDLGEERHGEAGVIAIFCGRLRAGERPRIDGDGTQPRDYLYVEELVGGPTVNTMPIPTMEAYLDHGNPAETLSEGLEEARASVARLSDFGIDYHDVTDNVLEREGVAKFVDSYRQLLSLLEAKRQRAAGAEARR